MSKKPICKWESTCDDECRRPYGRCPENCQNYKPYVSIEELEKENAELKEKNKLLENTCDSWQEIQKTDNELLRELEKENAELKAKLNGALDICNIPEFRINDLEKENARLSKMLNEAIDFIEQEDMQCKLCSSFSSCRDENCPYGDETPISDIIRAELEKRVENEG